MSAKRAALTTALRDGQLEYEDLGILTSRGQVINGGGPIHTKIGRNVRYRKADVLAWLDANSRRIERTSDLPGRR